MSHPHYVTQVFDEIMAQAKEANAYGFYMEDYRDFIKQKLEASKAKHPFMKDIEHRDYSIYVSTRMYEQFCVPPPKGPPPTSKDFWEAAFDYDPSVTASSGSTKLHDIMGSGQLEYVTIGKLWGQTELRLMPGIGSLPAQELPNTPPLGFAPSRCGAISYPDGHPSEDNLLLTVVSGTSPRPKTRPVITPNEDNKLRRFCSLGWVVMQKPRGQWRMTGHVLVMDMDDRAVRHRQPWLVLASEWPKHADDILDDEYSDYADEMVMRDDDDQPGVFPGDKNRTPICSIQQHLPKGAPRSHAPILKQLGRNFNFCPVRYGGPRPVRVKELGPGLARVMDWYWDPAKKQEVCFTEQGLEYMRYDPATKEYSFPQYSNLSFVGQQSMFGEIVAQEPAPEQAASSSGGFIPLSQRPGAPGGPPPTGRAPMMRRTVEHSSTGF
ncbi:MAG: hypothetical protein L6R39_005134 [Caloplaca ligustica]|nr:MAG: hypothetical protein L6R39_005134 [Caloplaca ligustica]